MPAEDHLLREQLTELLRGGEAHTNIASALEDFPADKRAVKPAGSPHNAWQLLEHMRLALDDLLDFCENSNYLAPKFPEGYWPKNEKPSTNEWDKSVAAVVAALKQFEDLVANHDSNLYAKIPWGDGQTLLREVLIAADHTSYHLGQFVLLRKQLEVWNE
jgi:hypothetical protein